MGIWKMWDLVRHANTKIKDANLKVAEIVKNCKACQLTNTVANQKNPGNRFRDTKPKAYQEIDVTEEKKGKFRYRHLLVYLYSL